MAPTSIEAIRSEFRRYRRLLELAVDQVDDATFFAPSDPDGNSIAVIVQHLAGNLRSRFTRFLTTDGEKPWRQRDGEFEEPTCDRAALLECMNSAWAILDAALDEVAEQDAWLDTVTIRRQPLTVMEALYRSLAHHAYHVGQIILLARSAAGDSWVSLSVPKGGSAAYEANPTRERTPDASPPRNSTQDLARRPADPLDRSWLDSLRRSVNKEVFDATFGGWDEERHRRHADACWNAGDIEIILRGGQPVAMIQTHQHAGYLEVGEIQVARDEQSQGIGTSLIQAVLTRGVKAGLPVRLSVGLKNLRAKTLYERTGFKEVGRSDSHVHMEAGDGTSRDS